ncbi:MAG: hypothetical protein QOH35_2793 [Acidobacteriaceae bacterium]|jgi:hypothetical protein|nr:hypothetical protein [Acidobacteriaceae bacterium]
MLIALNMRNRHTFGMILTSLWDVLEFHPAMTFSTIEFKGKNRSVAF